MHEEKSVQRTVELPSTVTERYPLTCGDVRRVAPKSPEIGQSHEELDVLRAKFATSILLPVCLADGQRNRRARAVGR